MDDDQGSFDFPGGEDPPKKPPRWARPDPEDRPTSPVIENGQDYADDEIQKRFRQFHLDNPHIYQALVDLARQAKRRGRKKYSIELLFGRLRWQMEIEVASEEPFKLNDHYTSRYARKLMLENPDLADLFEIRVLKRSKGAKTA